MHHSAIQYKSNPLSDLFLVDGRTLLFFAFLMSALSLRQPDPERVPKVATVTVIDTVKVFVSADSMAAYVLAEVANVEKKMRFQAAGLPIVPDETNAFEVGIFEIFRREGYRPRVYRCPAGLETVGLGDVIDTESEKVFRSAGMPFSVARVKLYANMVSGADEINRRFPGKYKTPNQWIALSMLGHSIGWDRLQKKYPAFYNEIASGKPSRRWLKYCRYRDGKTGAIKSSTNLVRTRSVEWALFNGDYSALKKYHKDAASVVKIRWKKGLADSLRQLGRE